MCSLSFFATLSRRVLSFFEGGRVNKKRNSEKEQKLI